jgi:hypothetical protein
MTLSVEIYAGTGCRPKASLAKGLINHFHHSQHLFILPLPTDDLRILSAVLDSI